MYHMMSPKLGDIKNTIRSMVSAHVASQVNLTHKMRTKTGMPDMKDFPKYQKYNYVVIIIFLNYHPVPWRDSI
jgi:hypothetical protein